MNFEDELLQDAEDDRLTVHGGLDLGLDLLADGLLEAELPGGDGDRDHDLRMRVQAFLLEFGGGGEDGAVLGLGDQREADVQTDTGNYNWE